MGKSLGEAYLESVIKRQLTYKTLGERTFAQLEEKDFHYAPALSATEPSVSNSIAVIIQHISGNMMSRWTNFLTEDGEKEGRNREMEFSELPATRVELITLWDKGWSCLLDTLLSLKAEHLMQTIHIRHEPLLVVDAINRQLAHYPHHVGQIVYIGKMIRGKDWESLSIARGDSGLFNQTMKDQHTGK